MKNKSAVEFIFIEVAGLRLGQVRPQVCSMKKAGGGISPTSTYLWHFLNFATCGKSRKYTGKVVDKVAVSLGVYQNLYNTLVWFLLPNLKTFTVKDKALSLKCMTF